MYKYLYTGKQGKILSMKILICSDVSFCHVPALHPSVSHSRCLIRAALVEAPAGSRVMGCDLLACLSLPPGVPVVTEVRLTVGRESTSSFLTNYGSECAEMCLDGQHTYKLHS